jgi:hypothetical protein
MKKKVMNNSLIYSGSKESQGANSEDNKQVKSEHSGDSDKAVTK